MNERLKTIVRMFAQFGEFFNAYFPFLSMFPVCVHHPVVLSVLGSVIFRLAQPQIE